MTPTEKAIRDFCGHHADWWPSTTQVQEMLALVQPCSTCEALARADEREECVRKASIALLGADKALTDRVLKAIRARGNT